MLTHEILSDAAKIRELWEDFGKIIGLESLHNLYGDYWPRDPIPGEIVFVWHDENRYIGWMAIRPDPVEQIMWIIAGILPQYQDQDYHKIMFIKTITEGWEIYSHIKWVCMSISHHNTRFIKYLDNLTKEVCWFRRVGGMDIPPPGYIVFALEKEKYLKSKNG